MAKVDMYELQTMVNHAQKLLNDVFQDLNIVGTDLKKLGETGPIVLDLGMFVGAAFMAERLADHMKGHVAANDHRADTCKHLLGSIDRHLDQLRKIAKTSSGLVTEFDLRRYLRQEIAEFLPNSSALVLDVEEAAFLHKKRGTTYSVVRELELEAGGISHPMIEYEGHSDGQRWFRISEEFFDGRFEAISPAAIELMEKYHATKH